MKSIFDESTRRELRARIQQWEGTEAPVYGTMNPDRAVCHLIDSLQAPFNPQIQEQFKKSFFSSRFGQWLTISSPVPWPKGKIKIDSNLEPFFFKSTPSETFENDKQDLIDEIDRFANSRDQKFYPSPVFGELTPKQWSKLQYRHINHHLEQFGR